MDTANISKIKFNIIIPYRPLSMGGMQVPDEELHQNEDGTWNHKGGKLLSGMNRYGGGDELQRCIRFINKNSFAKHDITVATDSDVFFHEDYLKQYDNVKVVKSTVGTKDVPQGVNRPYYRENAAVVAGINSTGDEEWICHVYIADILCGKNWDKPIIEAIEKHGENYVYVPMFTEIRTGLNRIITPDRIWVEWRKLACHNLYMPEPERGYFTEEDMNKYMEIANQANMGIIFERPGDRIYGYYATMVLKAKHAKKAIRFNPSETAWDLDFDNRLHSVCGLQKAVITNSFVFHPWCDFNVD